MMPKLKVICKDKCGHSWYIVCSNLNFAIYNSSFFGSSFEDAVLLSQLMTLSLILRRSAS